METSIWLLYLVYRCEKLGWCLVGCLKFFVGAHKHRLLCWLHVIGGPSPTLLGVLLLRSHLFRDFYWMFDLSHWSSLWPAVVHFTKQCSSVSWDLEFNQLLTFCTEKPAVLLPSTSRWSEKNALFTRVGWIWDVKIATLLPLLLFILCFGSAWCNAALVFTGMEWPAWFSLKILPMWTLSAYWGSTATSTAHSTMTSKVTHAHTDG